MQHFPEYDASVLPGVLPERQYGLLEIHFIHIYLILPSVLQVFATSACCMSAGFCLLIVKMTCMLCFYFQCQEKKMKAEKWTVILLMWGYVDAKWTKKPRSDSCGFFISVSSLFSERNYCVYCWSWNEFDSVESRPEKTMNVPWDSQSQVIVHLGGEEVLCVTILTFYILDIKDY